MINVIYGCVIATTLPDNMLGISALLTTMSLVILAPLLVMILSVVNG